MLSKGLSGVLGRQYCPEHNRGAGPRTVLRAGIRGSTACHDVPSLHTWRSRSGHWGKLRNSHDQVKHPLLSSEFSASLAHSPPQDPHGPPERGMLVKFIHKRNRAFPCRVSRQAGRTPCRRKRVAGLWEGWAGRVMGQGSQLSMNPGEGHMIGFL